MLRACGSYLRRQTYKSVLTRWATHAAAAEVEVKQHLRSVKASGDIDVMALGAVHGVKADTATGIVNIDLNMGVPGHPSTTTVKEQCEKVLKKSLTWVQEVVINDTSIAERPKGLNGGIESLANVEHVIAVSSCKGGVGKSTVAVNLAMTLAKRGLRVGLVDADVYGPSLPLMVQPTDRAVMKSAVRDNWVRPLVAAECTNLKFLSFGHVNPKAGVAGAGGKGAAIMRGPVVSRVINQLITATEWGCLDYLIVDMPPGTGDIQITLTQTLSLTGSVVVTTPHPLSTVDASKGIQMFESLHVPVLVLVENMSYFKCDLGTVYYPFGRGGKEALVRGLLQGDGDGDRDRNSGAVAQTIRGLERCPLHQFPLTAALSGHSEEDRDSDGDGSGGDGGESVGDNVANAERERKKRRMMPLYSPVQADSEPALLYSAMADDVILEIAKQSMTAALIPSLSYQAEREGGSIVLRYFGASSVTEYVVPAWQVRDRDPLTGALLPDAPSEEERQQRYSSHGAGVHPVTFDVKGNYGVSIVWSDGHYADIFPFDVLSKLAEELSVN